MSAWTSGNYPLFLKIMAEKGADLSGTITAHLTNATPSTAHDGLSDITEIATGGGYTQGTGLAVTTSTSAMSGSTYQLTLSGTIGFTATGTVADFRYAVLCLGSETGDPVFMYLDMGETVSLEAGHILAIDVDTVVVFSMAFS